MQGKALIQFFTTLALLVVLYQFMLWLPAYNVESNAEAAAEAAVVNIDNPGIKEMKRDSVRFAYLDSVSNLTVFSIPGLKGYTYQELKKQQIAWGLDLQGGMSVVMQVNLKELIIALASDSEDDNFLKALDKAEEMQSNTQTDYVALFGQAYNELTDEPMARIFTLNEQLKEEKINIKSTNAEVLAAIRKVATESVESTHNLLKKRIDRFGVAQPTVSLDKSTDRITVELPGIRNPKRARQYLVATANLEFWELYQNTEIINQIDKLNSVLKKKEAIQNKINEIIREDTASTDIATTEIDTNSAETNDLGLGEELEGDSTETDYGPLYKVLGLNVPRNAGEASAAIGYTEGRNRAAVDEILNSPEAKKILPKSARFVWDSKFAAGKNGEKFYTLYALNTKGRKESKLSGERVVSAYATPNPSGRGFAVSLSMDDEGARVWKKMTTDNVGRQVAVVLDNKVYSAPNVNEPIAGGNTSISGGFDDVTEAKDLANILSIGKLPSRPEIIEEAVVGPSLGADTVSAGLWSLIIGFILVLIFMLSYYGAAGMIAVLSLVLNIFFIMGALASFGTVLTLPGIAGIVLTIGMAVDASVIIFERIREELRAGSEWKLAILNGFKYSYSAILDANITTLVVAIVLYKFGLGPIKGFATVLGIGVVCSVFSAVLIGRMLFDTKIQANKQVSVWAGWSKNILANPGFDFLAKRKIAYIVSGIILVAGLGSMVTRSFEFGIDFRGGRSYTVEFSNEVDATALKGEIIAAFETLEKDQENANKTLVRQFSKNNQVKITTSFLQGQELEMNVDSVILLKLYEGAKNYAKGSTSYADFENAVASSGENAFFMTGTAKVDATIADDIRTSAGWAAGLSLLFIFLYIFARFNKWQYSAGALAALVHDVLFVLAIFSLFHGILPFSLEIDQAFIAAILTVIGYSINDTVVVFDRIREVGKELQDKASFKDIANIALNNTISRTCITSLTTLMVVFILFLFGGDGIRGFAFALVIGVLVGTYSSIFIATPIVVDTVGDNNIFDAPAPVVVEGEDTQEAVEA